MDGAGKRLPAPDDAPAPEAAIVLAEEKKLEKPSALDAMEGAIENVCEAVRAALASPSINKFTEASRLCQIGHQLQKARAKSIEDFEKLAVEEAPVEGNAFGPVMAVNNVGVGNYVVGGGWQAVEGEMAPIRQPRRRGHPLLARDGQGNVVDRNPGEIRRDAAGNLANEAPPLPEPPAMGPPFEFAGRDDPAFRDPTMRRVMLAVEPAMQVQRATNAAQAAESESEELKNLLEVRGKLPKDKRGVIDARIDALVDSVEARVLAREQQDASKKVTAEMAAERKKTNGQAPLVHPDVPR